VGECVCRCASCRAGYAGQNKSAIISIGLTIHNAPVELREKLAVPEAEWPRAIEELCSYPHIEEAAVLSTCNRMELYVVAVSWHRGVREVRSCYVAHLDLQRRTRNTRGPHHRAVQHVSMQCAGHRVVGMLGGGMLGMRRHTLNVGASLPRRWRTG
jgi:hypothetical protein